MDTPFEIAHPHPLVEATFLERPNRFVAFCDLNGERVRVHVPDPGRLKELLIPGVRVYLEDHGDSPTRKTRYALFLVTAPDGSGWVSLNTQLPNRVVKTLLTEHWLKSFAEYRLVKPEFKWGTSRFDFLLEHPVTKRQHLLEVKSVTLVLDDKTAMFPDAPTTRGTRHLRELIAAKQSGDYEASVLFVVQRGDALCVKPNADTDPDFCRAVADAHEAGVSFTAISYELTPKGLCVSPSTIPVQTALSPVLQ